MKVLVSVTITGENVNGPQDSRGADGSSLLLIFLEDLSCNAVVGEHIERDITGSVLAYMPAND